MGLTTVALATVISPHTAIIADVNILIGVKLHRFTDGTIMRPVVDRNVTVAWTISVGLAIDHNVTSATQ